MFKLMFKDGKEVNKGDVTTTFKGETVKIMSWKEPHKPSSSGKVYVEFENGAKMEYYPQVVEARFIEI